MKYSFDVGLQIGIVSYIELVPSFQYASNYLASLAAKKFQLAKYLAHPDAGKFWLAEYLAILAAVFKIWLAKYLASLAEG